jgi:hypothetical protein
VDRLRAWLVVAPLVVAGTLVAHAGAYRLTGTPTGSLHSYLEHAPQLVLLVSLLAIALAGLRARLQEHVERLVHTGELPWILTTPAVLLGLVLQVPVALCVWLVAARLLSALGPGRLARARVAYALIVLAAPVTIVISPARERALPARGPPALLRP